MSAGPLDEVLDRFAATGPEFGPGLSNHGPMAAEALVALGRADAVAPWAEVLETWVPRLAPGIMAGATHGILRTAHAVRSLERGVTGQRLAELGEGLGYWAARYQLLPGAARPQTLARLRVPEAVARVPLLPDEKRSRGLIFDAVKAIEPDGFAPVIDLVDVDGDPGAFVSEITRTFVRHYLANAPAASISFIHTVTAPSALRILSPHLSPDTRRSVMRYAWQACASIYAAYGTTPRPPEPAAAAPQFDAADLIDQAVAARDEHAIKFTEACLREYAITPDGAFIAAARDAVVRLKR